VSGDSVISLPPRLSRVEQHADPGRYAEQPEEQ
jgi:hypothetical protein